MIDNRLWICNKFSNKLRIHLIMLDLLVIVCFKSVLWMSLNGTFSNYILSFTWEFSQVLLLINFFLIMDMIYISKLDKVNSMLIWNYITTISSNENKRVVFSWIKIFLRKLKLKAWSFFASLISKINWNNSV